MKLIKYQLMTEVNHGTEEEPNIVQTFSNKEILCNDGNFEANLAIAKSEAYNGEVTVEDVPDEETEPSTEERLTTLEETTTQQGEILNILLSGETEESV